MKKLILASLAALFSCTMGVASEAPMQATAPATTTATSPRVSIPTGTFWNNKNFVKVESSWVRIYINRQSSEYDIRNAEIDPSGNYALVLSNGASITIYSNGRSLYYDGSTYTRSDNY